MKGYRLIYADITADWLRIFRAAKKKLEIEWIISMVLRVNNLLKQSTKTTVQ